MNRTGDSLVLGLVLLALIATPAEAASRKLPPVEQCGGDPAFVAFRKQLQRAVERRQPQALIPLLAPNVLVNFGGDSGRKAFASQWELDRPSKSGLWGELAAVLRLGCAKIEQARVMPSFHVQFSLENDLDPFETMLVASPDARLHATRGAASPEIATLTWDVVTAVEASDDGSQIKVRLADGREGWLKRTELRSALDYRLIMEKRRGKWMVTAFVAGD